MRRVFCTLILAGSMALASADSDTSSYSTTADYTDFGKLGGEAADRAIKMSMFGWGLALAIGITIVALVVPSSTGS